MNRKAFLSSIAALISIPFLGKSKAKAKDQVKEWSETSKKETVSVEDIAKHYNVSPDTILDFGQSTFINRPITESGQQWVKANPCLLENMYIPEDRTCIIYITGKPIATCKAVDIEYYEQTGQPYPVTITSVERE